MRGIEYKITCKVCSIALVQQKIKIENAFAKFFKQIDELINEIRLICSKAKTRKVICGKVLQVL